MAPVSHKAMITKDAQYGFYLQPIPINDSHLRLILIRYLIIAYNQTIKWGVHLQELKGASATLSSIVIITCCVMTRPHEGTESTVREHDDKPFLCLFVRYNNTVLSSYNVSTEQWESWCLFVSVFDIHTHMHSWCVCVCSYLWRSWGTKRPLRQRQENTDTHCYIIKHTEITGLVQRPRTPPSAHATHSNTLTLNCGVVLLVKWIYYG